MDTQAGEEGYKVPLFGGKHFLVGTQMWVAIEAHQRDSRYLLFQIETRLCIRPR